MWESEEYSAFSIRYLFVTFQVLLCGYLCKSKQPTGKLTKEGNTFYMMLLQSWYFPYCDNRPATLFSSTTISWKCFNLYHSLDCCLPICYLFSFSILVIQTTLKFVLLTVHLTCTLSFSQQWWNPVSLGHCEGSSANFIRQT